MATQPSLRLISANTPNIGHFVRVGRSDHRRISEVIAENRLEVTGLVIDATLAADRHAALLAEADMAGVWRVLDPRSLDLSLSSTPSESLTALPWASEAVLAATDSNRPTLLRLARRLVAFVIEYRLDAVLAPTHFIDIPNSPWLRVDRSATQILREELDRAGAADVAIYYPIAVPGTLIRNPAYRAAIIAQLRDLPIDQLWVRIHPFGSTSGPMAFRGYVEACIDMHALGYPVVAEHTGAAGLALAALGAAGGFEGGVTRGERFDTATFRARDGSGWSMAPRVYVHDLELYLTRRQFREYSGRRRGKALLACRDMSCCPRGAEDMLARPIRHFLLQRQREIRQVSAVPESERGKNYVDEVLRPAVDRAAEAVHLDALFGRHHERMDARRRVAEALLPDLRAMSRSPLATTGRLQARPSRPHSV